MLPRVRAFAYALGEALDDSVANASSGKPDRVRDRPRRRIAVGDDDEALEADQVGAAEGVGVEPGPQGARGRPDEQRAEPPPRRAADLLAQRLEDDADRPF